MIELKKRFSFYLIETKEQLAVSVKCMRYCTLISNVLNVSEHLHQC